MLKNIVLFAGLLIVAAKGRVSQSIIEGLDIEEKVQSLRAGADDYLGKPFDFDEQSKSKR